MLTPGHWIAIAMIAVAVLGGILSSALSEHNARLANVEAGTNDIAEALGRVEREIKPLDERLDRIESNIDSLVQLHLDAETKQPVGGRGE